ncbi:MAG: Yop proteins translocation protein K [Puniceicoccales bacterium]|jgi:hypothetical protein|nr:Yop proteins translocation protein K [Puniceicoccales bacterium]
MVDIAKSLKNIVVSNFDYFQNWYNFNFKIEESLSSKRREQILNVYRQDVFEILLGSECTKTTLRKNLLSIFGLTNVVDYDIAGEVVQLAITKKELLERAMIASGAIFWYREIAKIVSKKELNALQEFIGEDVYSFIIRRGMMLSKMVPPLKKTFSKGEMIGKQIAETGREILCRALFRIPGEVKKRLDLILEEQLNIPAECDEILAKKCFDLMKFSLEKLNVNKGNQA